MKFGQLTDIVMSNIFRVDFEWFGGLGPSCFSIFQPTTTINPKSIMMNFWFFTLMNVCTETAKNVKYHLIKINRTYQIAIFSK